MRSATRALLLTLLLPALPALGCATEGATDEDGVDPVELELRSTDLEPRGAIAPDSCLHTSGERARKYITFSFSATRGETFAISTAGYVSPDLRILSEAGKQLLRGRKRFEGDGVDGEFISEARFVAPSTATYLVAVRDTSVAPGAPLPASVRPIVTIDDVDTARRPGACPAVP